MNRKLRAGVAGLAFLGLVAQPMAANAIICPPCPPATTGYDAGPVPMLLVTGFFLCAGVTLGKQDVDAKGQPVSGKDRVHGLLSCLLPFHHHKA